MDEEKRKWHRKQVKAFGLERANYILYAEKLEAVLKKACAAHAPTALVQSRAKSLESFAEKSLRKYHKYKDPVHQLTDLCGARVVTYTRDEVERICRFVTENFDVDEANSLDVGSRLRISEFGYRAIHYVVCISQPQVLGISIPPEIRNRKAEIQVCTMLQHTWAAIGHDRLYKAEVRAPDGLVRSLHEVAALFENADERFAQAVQALDVYISDFDAYMSPQLKRDEIDKCEAVLALDKSNEAVAQKIAQLVLSMEQCDRAVRTLKPFRGSRTSSVVRDLGRAKCRTGKPRLVLSGRKDLKRAVRLDPSNVNALCDLGDSWREEDTGEALRNYKLAFEVAPTDPRVLRSYLECKIQTEGRASFLPLMRGSLEAAIAECRKRVDLGVYLPEAYYDMGIFLLFLDRPYDSLNAYSKAVQLSPSRLPIEAAFVSLTKLKKASRNGELQGLEWARRFLIVASTAKALLRLRDAESDATCGKAEVKKAAEEARKALKRTRLKGMGTKKPPSFDHPIIIVAGGCDGRAQRKLRSAYGECVRIAFDSFKGTIISGGTTAGISGMIGNLRSPRPGDIVKIAYLPRRKVMPRADRIDRRYKRYLTDGEGYTPLGPIQTWADLLLAGVRPWEVKLLGINGGRLAAFEYRLGLALGAKVGIVESSGRAASDLLPDAEWWDVPNLVKLPHDPMTLRAFVNAGKSRLDPARLQDAARAIHADYVEANRCNENKVDPSMMPWEGLRKDFRDSNVQQAAYAEQILRCFGYVVEAVPPGEEIELPGFTEDEVRQMAEMEHGRWNAERLAAGWRYGAEPDPKKRINSNIVPWENLPESIREYDYRAVRNFPKVLAKAGLRVFRLNKGDASK